MKSLQHLCVSLGQPLYFLKQQHLVAEFSNSPARVVYSPMCSRVTDYYCFPKGEGDPALPAGTRPQCSAHLTDPQL